MSFTEEKNNLTEKFIAQGPYKDREIVLKPKIYVN